MFNLDKYYNNIIYHMLFIQVKSKVFIFSLSVQIRKHLLNFNFSGVLRKKRNDFQMYVVYLTQRTGATVEWTHGVQALYQWSNGASTIVVRTFIHILTAVTITLPPCHLEDIHWCLNRSIPKLNLNYIHMNFEDIIRGGKISHG